MARARCWKMSWVVDLDIKSFYDDVQHDLLMKAVRRHCTNQIDFAGWNRLICQRTNDRDTGEICAHYRYLHTAVDKTYRLYKIHMTDIKINPDVF